MHRPRQRQLLLLLCLLPASAAACQQTDTAPPSDAGDDFYPRCPGVPEFHLGLSQLGEQRLVEATLESATPAQPQKHENDWTLKLTDPAGEPISGLELYRVQPWMPEHGHDGTFDPTIKAGDAEGVYVVEAINLWMKDLWEVRLFVHVDDERDDKVVFNVCIPP
jgi:YtkA-like